MLTSLDWLVIVFMIMVATSFLSLCLMFLVRRPHIKRVCFYIVVALSIYAAAVGIAAIVIDRTSKGDEKKLKIARIMAATTLVIGIINTFM